MNKTILITMMTLLTMTAIVSADCSDYEISQFGYCYGATIFTDQWDYFSCYRYDMAANNDGVINLIDLVYFAQSCETSSGEKKWKSQKLEKNF